MSSLLNLSAYESDSDVSEPLFSDAGMATAVSKEAGEEETKDAQTIDSVQQEAPYGESPADLAQIAKSQNLMHVQKMLVNSKTELSPPDQQAVETCEYYLTAAQEHGFHLIDTIRNNKEFANPYILAKVVDFYHIEQSGSNFSPDVFNPQELSAADFEGNFKRRKVTTTVATGTTGSSSSSNENAAEMSAPPLLVPAVPTTGATSTSSSSSSSSSSSNSHTSSSSASAAVAAAVAAINTRLQQQQQQTTN